MIDVQVSLNGTVTPNKMILSNRWENNDEKLIFTFPEEFKEYAKYLIGVMKQSTGNKTVILPITNNACYISSQLTYLSGNWNLYVMCREIPMDLDAENIDISAKNNERVFISDVFIGTINKNMITQEAIENIPLDTNLQVAYDDLYAFKQEVIDKIDLNEDELTTSAKTVVYAINELLVKINELNNELSILKTDYPKLNEEDALALTEEVFR